MTKNTHLEHPEDTILTGDLSVLDGFLMPQDHISVKFDGAPAIVWGRNPATGKQFVGTKSVFNKVKIKICESAEDIVRLYEGNLRIILSACLANLPITNNIYQGDFIGFGGKQLYTPNVITYDFFDIVSEEIIIAPHTLYTVPENCTLKDAQSQPLLKELNDTNLVKFVNPKAYVWDGDYWTDNVTFNLGDLCKFARQMATLVEFEDKKGAAQLKKDINAYIRDNDEIVAEEFDNYMLVRLWLLVKEIKEICLYQLRHRNGPDSYIDNDLIDAEGYVIHNKYGSYKLINREVFSYANFNKSRFSNV